MNYDQTSYFLKEMGILLYADKSAKNRWATRPLAAATPIHRFASLKKVMDYWRARCKSTLHEIYEIEESIRIADLYSPSVAEAKFLSLQGKQAFPYTRTLDYIQSNLPRRPAPKHWKKRILNEVQQLGTIDAEVQLWRAAYFRALSRLGYHRKPQVKTPRNDSGESEDRGLD